MVSARREEKRDETNFQQSRGQFVSLEADLTGQDRNLKRILMVTRSVDRGGVHGVGDKSGYFDAWFFAWILDARGCTMLWAFLP